MKFDLHFEVEDSLKKKNCGTVQILCLLPIVGKRSKEMSTLLFLPNYKQMFCQIFFYHWHNKSHRISPSYPLISTLRLSLSIQYYLILMHFCETVRYVVIYLEIIII